MLRHDIKPELFARRHPRYEDLLQHWRFVDATYRGGASWFTDNIFKYVKESDRAYADRVKRGYRFNHTREVVDLVTKYVMKPGVTRAEDATDALRAFWKRATRSGESIDALMRNTSKDMSLFGQPYVVVDSTAKLPENGPMTVAEAKRQGARVFAYLVRPQDALDMSFDEMGQFNWFLHREYHRDDENFDSDQVSEVRFRLWTRTHSSLFRVRQAQPGETAAASRSLPALSRVFKPSAAGAGAGAPRLVVEEISSTRHDLGLVPVVRVPERDSEDDYHAPAMVDDIAYLDRATANYLSNLDAIIQDQTFSTLVIPAQSLVEDDEDATRDMLIDLGTKSVFTYDAEGGVGPQYISPDPKQAQMIIGVITKIITEIYHSVGMAGERTKMDNAAGIDNSSGVAKAYDFDRMNTMLKAKSERMEAAEREVARLVEAWNGRTLSDEEAERLVVYPTDFDTRNLYDEFDVAARLALIDAPDALRRHQFDLLIDKLFPTMSKALRAKVEAELKDWPVDPMEMMLAAADQPGSVPGKAAEKDGQVRAPSALKDRAKPTPDNKQGQNNKDSGAA